MTKLFNTFVLSLTIVFAAAGATQAGILTEDFPDPLGGFYSRWLGANSNIGSVYLSDGSSSDPNFRGNNSDSLWISGNQTFGGGVGGPLVTINFNPSFGATLTSLSFIIDAFVQLDARMYDESNNLIASGVFNGGNFDFDNHPVFSGTSANGISKFELDSSAYSGFQVSGNTAVDDFLANAGPSTATPEPGSLTLLGLGLASVAGLGWMKKRKTKVVVA